MRVNFSIPKQLGAEAVGTFCLVFAGTGAIVINDVTGGMVTHLGIAITFGTVVMSMIYTLGDISGAHLNPAVTIGFVTARRLPIRTGILFVSSQLAGAVLASACLKWIFPTNGTLGITQPSGAVSQTFILEMIITFILMFVILGVSTGAKEKGITAGLAIGSTVMFAALFAGPISGASMNPARSFGPALAALDFSFLWLYFAAPIVGSMLAVAACRCVREDRCCMGIELQRTP